MRYLTALWRLIRRTDDLAAAHAMTARALEEAEHAINLSAHLAAQLRASRAEHANTLRRLVATEGDYADVCDALAEHRHAARMWITRTVKPRVECN
jgi:acyl transferase domain-containing protein